ncbi:MAG: hypothetical protein IT342_27515 [Candidatus Melainabacteria bacterium]|nr:hypothetical protein [Candidatus Melainabacteria bacterium]
MKATLFFAIFILVGSQSPSYAKIGESISSFRNKTAQKFKFRTQESRGAQTNYRFAFPLTPEEEARCPGFGTGVTVTVAGGKIVGQSMAIRMGDAYDEGRAMAARRALDFILEAIGKPKSTSQSEDSQQLASIKSAIEQAMISNPQNIQFPGFPQRAKLSCSPDGDLLIAVLPPIESAPPGSYMQGGPPR